MLPKSCYLWVFADHVLSSCSYLLAREQRRGPVEIDCFGTLPHLSYWALLSKRLTLRKHARRAKRLVEPCGCRRATSDRLETLAFVSDLRVG